jgi:hypothetical protein
MASRIKITGVILLIIGLLGVAASGYAYIRYQDGADALQGFSDAQQVTLSYNDDGELVDRGTTEGADAILALLGETWRWPIVDGELDSDDPLVNTATEYMFQMATIAQHTLHGTQEIVLDATVEWDGDGDDEISPDAAVYFGGEWDPSTSGEDAVFNAGTYEVPVNERYWTQFNRQHPLDGPARSATWDGTVFGLFAQLGVGATTASTLQLSLGVIAVTFLMSIGFLAAGGGLVWAGMGGRKEEEPATS